MWNALYNPIVAEAFPLFVNTFRQLCCAAMIALWATTVSESGNGMVPVNYCTVLADSAMLDPSFYFYLLSRKLILCRVLTAVSNSMPCTVFLLITWALSPFAATACLLAVSARHSAHSCVLASLSLRELYNALKLCTLPVGMCLTGDPIRAIPHLSVPKLSF